MCKSFLIIFPKHFSILWVLFIFSNTIIYSQNKDIVSINFSYKLDEGKSGFALDKLKYYVSHPVFKDKMNDTVYSTDRYFLVDHCDKQEVQYELSIPSGISYDSLCFTVGIDSLTNTQGVGELDLDPIHGMYWTWQTGYINVKIEGTSVKSSARKNDVTYHLGGFLNGLRCDQFLCLVSNSSNKNHSIQLDLDHFFTQVDIENTPYIMSPKKEAVIMSSSFANSLTLLKK